MAAKYFHIKLQFLAAWVCFLLGSSNRSVSAWRTWQTSAFGVCKQRGFACVWGAQCGASQGTPGVGPVSSFLSLCSTFPAPGCSPTPINTSGILVTCFGNCWSKQQCFCHVGSKLEVQWLDVCSCSAWSVVGFCWQLHFFCLNNRRNGNHKGI